MNLSTKQKQHLKGLAHSLKPVVLIGANGLTEAVLAEMSVALDHHELIKVKAASRRPRNQDTDYRHDCSLKLKHKKYKLSVRY